MKKIKLFSLGLTVGLFGLLGCPSDTAASNPGALLVDLVTNPQGNAITFSFKDGSPSALYLTGSGPTATLGDDGGTPVKSYLLRWRILQDGVELTGAQLTALGGGKLASDLDKMAGAEAALELTFQANATGKYTAEAQFYVDSFDDANKVGSAQRIDFVASPPSPLLITNIKLGYTWTVTGKTETVAPSPIAQQADGSWASQQAPTNVTSAGIEVSKIILQDLPSWVTGVTAAGVPGDATTKKTTVSGSSSGTDISAITADFTTDTNTNSKGAIVLTLTGSGGLTGTINVYFPYHTTLGTAQDLTSDIKIGLGIQFGSGPISKVGPVLPVTITSGGNGTAKTGTEHAQDPSVTISDLILAPLPSWVTEIGVTMGTPASGSLTTTVHGTPNGTDLSGVTATFTATTNTSSKAQLTFTLRAADKTFRIIIFYIPTHL